MTLLDALILLLTVYFLGVSIYTIAALDAIGADVKKMKKKQAENRCQRRRAR